MPATLNLTAALNQGQQAAADGFFSFLFSAENELIISGPGGVGKTFLMGHLIDQVMPRYHESCRILGIDPIYRTVQMTATTNKAAEVLGQATGRPTKTIHSFLNLRIQEDYSTGVSKLIKTPNWTVHRNMILFVDESSMIDHKLLQLIREGTHECKIIYVGDHCQLAPVTETLSPIYRAKLPFYELTEPMRNAAQPALMNVCNQLRQTVETGVFTPIHTVPGVIDLLDGPAVSQEISQHFMDPSNNDRILAYTNSRVLQYNDHIREMRGLPKTLTAGEHVINNTAISMGRLGMLSVEDEFTVHAVSPTTHKVQIDQSTELEILYCTLVGAHNTFSGVPIPVDREHFQALVRYYANQKNWHKYYLLKNTYPDLRPRDAATIHKAQGSSYDTTFIDLGDLSSCRDKSMAARLLYVAFSRARKRVVLYGQLAPKYGGIVTGT